MKATRFSMTLYISLPVLASACSVVMIAHFVMLAEGRIPEDGLYGDMYTYIVLAESFNFFGNELITFRVLAPLISGTIAALFGLTGEQSVGLLTGSLNFLYLLTGFGWMYYLAMKERTSNSLEVALPPFLVLTLPAFWQGVFLPVPDALMFALFALILTGVLRQRLDILVPAMLIGVFVSEWLFLAALLLPLTDYLRSRGNKGPGTGSLHNSSTDGNSQVNDSIVWTRGYTAVALAALAYLVLPLLTTIPEAHLVYRPGEWMDGIREQFINRDISVIRAFWRSFGLTLPFFAYRFYEMGWSRVTGALTIWFLLLFAVVYILAPDSANRILFMTMPALVLWQYEPGTFRRMNRPIDRESESEMG